MTYDLPAPRRRKHSIEFKADLVAMCRQPGVSVSAIALAHGVNANLLRKWIKKFPVDATCPASQTRLVPIQVEAVRAPAPAVGDIQLDIQRGETRINIRWPMDSAEACARWLGTWLK